MNRKIISFKKILESKELELKQAINKALELEIKNNELKAKLNSITPIIVEFPNNPATRDVIWKKFFNKYLIAYAITAFLIKDITSFIMKEIGLVPSKIISNFLIDNNICNEFLFNLRTTLALLIFSYYFFYIIFDINKIVKGNEKFSD